MSTSAPIANTAYMRPSWDEVIRLAGELDDATVETILSSGATCAEVEAAVAWASGEGFRLDRDGKPLTGTVAAVYEVLVATPAFGGGGKR